jgi:cytochrome P450
VDQLDRLLVEPTFVDDPYPAYRRLRDEDPVHWSEAWHAWVISGYDDIVASLRDHAGFSSADRLLELVSGIPQSAPGAEAIRHHFATPGLIHADPPSHERLRGLVSKAFSARVIEGLRPRIQDIVDQLIGPSLARGHMDVLADLAYPLPAIVIAELLGAPPEDRELFKRWSDDIVAFQGTGRAKAEAVNRSGAGITDMRAYLSDLFAERRRGPHDDLLGSLVASEGANDQLTVEELYSTCVTFLIAGHETTTSLIANGTLLLLRHPTELATVRADPTLLAPALEECLRFESPIQRGFRRVARDFEFRGKQLREGQIVIQLLGAANRDPKVFDEPDTFKSARRPNRHIAFGSGIHFCIGAPLARLEAPIAIGTMLRLMPDLHLDDEPISWQAEKSLFRCVSSLPVTF